MRCWGITDYKKVDEKFFKRDKSNVINIGNDRISVDDHEKNWKDSYIRKLGIANKDALTRTEEESRYGIMGPKELKAYSHFGPIDKSSDEFFTLVRSYNANTWVRIYTLKSKRNGKNNELYQWISDNMKTTNQEFKFKNPFKPEDRDYSEGTPADKCTFDGRKRLLQKRKFGVDTNLYNFNADCVTNYHHSTFVTVENNILLSLWKKRDQFMYDAVNEYIKLKSKNPTLALEKFTYKFHERVYKLLGLNSSWGAYDQVISFEVKIKDLIRPCFNKNPLDKKCLLENDVGANEIKYLNEIKNNNLGDGGLGNAPFTGLGYTYDIHNVEKGSADIKIRDNKIDFEAVSNNQNQGRDIVGADEYIVPYGVMIRNAQLKSFQQYAKQCLDEWIKWLETKTKFNWNLEAYSVVL